ncbi:MAG TPA: hypothetical protein PLV42_09210 [bacterium]|nr:hypothetical protein [bacterium]
MSLLSGFLLSPFLWLALLLTALFSFAGHRTPLFRLVFFNVISFLVIAALFDALFAYVLLTPDHLFRTDHRYYHHGLKPYQDQTTKWGDYGERYRVRTNSLGMLDAEIREVPLKKEGRRIILMGDSFIEGVGFEYEKTVPGLVAAHFAPKGVEVLGAGTVSYSPKLHYLRMKYLLEEGLTFDDLYLFIDIGDIQDEIVYAYFVPDEHREPLWKERLSLFYYQHSWLFRLLRDRFSFRQENPRHEFSDYWGGLPQYYQVRPRWTHDEKEFERWGKQGLASALDYTDKLFNLLKKHNIVLHLSVHPWREQILREKGTSLQQSAWSLFCAERNIDFIDLFPLFQRNGSATEIIGRYFIEKDIHWNEAGMRLVADEIIARIESDGGSKTQEK